MPIVRNKKTGVTSSVPAHYIGHPVLGANIELVNNNIKVAEIKQEIIIASAPKKGNTTKEQSASEVAPVSVQPEITSKEGIEDGN